MCPPPTDPSLTIVELAGGAGGGRVCLDTISVAERSTPGRLRFKSKPLVCCDGGSGGVVGLRIRNPRPIASNSRCRPLWQVSLVVPVRGRGLAVLTGTGLQDRTPKTAQLPAQRACQAARYGPPSLCLQGSRAGRPVRFRATPPFSR